MWSGWIKMLEQVVSTKIKLNPSDNNWDQCNIDQKYVMKDEVRYSKIYQDWVWSSDTVPHIWGIYFYDFILKGYQVKVKFR